MYTSTKAKGMWKPHYVDGVDTCEDVIKTNNYGMKPIGVRCPKCENLFLIFHNTYIDDYGEYRKVCGFCTNCRHKIEALMNI